MTLLRKSLFAALALALPIVALASTPAAAAVSKKPPHHVAHRPIHKVSTHHKVTHRKAKPRTVHHVATPRVAAH